MAAKEPNLITKVFIILYRKIRGLFRRSLKCIKDFFARLVAAVVHFFRSGGALRVIAFIGKMLDAFFYWLIFRVLMPKKYRHITKKELHSIIFNSDTPAGRRFDIWLLILIGVNLLIITLDSFALIHEKIRWVMLSLEWILTILFTLEYYLRIYCSPNKRRYVFSFFGLIDILSIFPAYLSIFFPATHTLSVLRILRTLRIFRIFNMQKFMQESFHLLNALHRSAKKILIFMLFMFVAAIILGATLYMIESDVNPALTSIPKSIYWAVMTISTVGYGDITPVTTIGQILSTCVMLLGYSIIAVPTGIVAGETLHEYRLSHDNNETDELSNSDVKVCPHCGHVESQEQARYCIVCGTRLSLSHTSGWRSFFFSDNSNENSSS